MEILNAIPEEIISSVSLLVSFIVVFLVAKWLKDLLTPFNLNKQLTTEDNLAVAISITGYFIGVTIIFLGAVDGPSVGIIQDLIAVTGYSLGGAILLNISRILNDKLILYKFSTIKEIIEDKNPGTGVVQAASYVASGLIIAGAIHGEGGGILSALIFFLVGQVILIVFGLIYEKVTPYSVHDEIEKDNTAAGLGFAGGLVSIGVIIFKAISGDLESYADHFSTLGFDVALIIVLIVFVRFFFDKLIIPKADLAKEISEDKNVGAGMLEAFVSICFAAVLYFIL